MNRSNILSIFADASDEQIRNLLDINSADITHALNKQKGDGDQLRNQISELQAQLSGAKATIQTLEANKGDVEKLQKEIDAYRQAEAKRKEEEQAAAARRDLMERMDAVLGDRKFAHERLRDIVADDFSKALQDKANRGKSDADVFEAITRDQGYFTSQNPAAPNMPQFNPAASDAVKDKASFLKLNFGEQMKFKAEHPEEFKQIFAMPQ